MSGCPSPEVLRAFALLPRSERDTQVLSHLQHCAACQQVVNAETPTEQAPAGPKKPKAPREVPDVRAQRFGRYVLSHVLGQGGMGTVYAGYDPELDRTVALKVLRAGNAEEDAAGGARLLREARALARLSHPNVVAVHEVGTVDGQVFMAMEHVKGQPLDVWLKAAPRSWKQVLEVFLAAGRGLAAAHAAGLVHRDFKPNNVVMADDGRVRVLDFGLARSGEGTTEPMPGDPPPPPGGAVTVAGAVIGTPEYMSPEQLRGELLDARTDQFSFCLSLKEALGGSLSHRSGPLVEVIRAWARRPEPPLPASVRVPSRLRKVMARGLEVDRDERYPSMDLLLADLEAVLRSPLSSPRVAAAAGFSALLLAGGWAAGQAGAVDCRQARERTLSMWDEARRAKVGQAFEASGAVDAMVQLSRVTAALERAVTEVALAQQASCEQGASRGRVDELWALRSVCLERRAREADALIAALEAADAKTVHRAAEAVAALRPVSGCDNPVALAAQVSPPDDAQARARLNDARTKLSEARAALTAGQARAGLDAARSALAEARAVGYPPAEAEALLLEGQLLALDGQAAEAEASLLAAVLAAERGRQDEVKALAFLSLAEVAQAAQGREADAQRWLGQASAALERAGDPPELRARLDALTAAR